MSPTKLLQINPSLFNVNSNANKSIKHKPKSVMPQSSNIMNPNRKTLLAKIKNFQKKENEKEKNKTKIANKLSEINSKDSKSDENEFEGEFNKSLNFLQELSNRHTLKKKEKKNRSIKNLEQNSSLSASSQSTHEIKSEASIQQPIINLDLPMELQEIHINTSESPFNPMQLQLSENKINQISSNTIPNQTEFDIMQKPLIQKPSPIILQESRSQINNNDLNQSLHSATIQSETPPSSQTNIQILPPQPPYSNLKGTVKPTYREWMQKTQKNYKTNKHSNITFSNSNNSNIKIEESINPIISTQLHDPIISNKDKDSNVNSSKHKTPIQKINKKIRTIKYKLGKQGNKIGILIKNSNTRKKIKDEFLKLKRKNISEIKDNLRSKNLIKAGTLAPNDIIREIYEQSILTGDVINKNKDALIHNFFSDKN
jgi:hypothetical protein